MSTLYHMTIYVMYNNSCRSKYHNNITHIVYTFEQLSAVVAVFLGV